MIATTTLAGIECHMAAAEGLMSIANFVIDQATDDDMRQLHDPMSFLLGSITQELAGARRCLATLYLEHYQPTG